MANKLNNIRVDSEGNPVNGLIVQDDGLRAWYRDGLLHREDGPAVETISKDGGHVQIWCLMGEKIDCMSQEEFERIVKLKAFW
jgi:hypothetical protein